MNCRVGCRSGSGCARVGTGYAGRGTDYRLVQFINSFHICFVALLVEIVRKHLSVFQLFLKPTICRQFVFDTGPVVPYPDAAGHAVL